MGIWIWRPPLRGFLQDHSYSRATTHVKGIGPEAAPAFAKGIAAARGTSEEEGAGTFAAPAVTFVNPGSIGHPKDGSASYAIYEHGTVELHQL